MGVGLNYRDCDSVIFLQYFVVKMATSRFVASGESRDRKRRRRIIKCFSVQMLTYDIHIFFHGQVRAWSTARTEGVVPVFLCFSITISGMSACQLCV